MIHSFDSIVKDLKLNQELTKANKFISNYEEPQFQNDIVPDFEEGEFIIKDYEWIKDTYETVFSDILVSNGLSWKLKVYPNGNGNAKKTYLSVFLEMVKG